MADGVNWNIDPYNDPQVVDEMMRVVYKRMRREGTKSLVEKAVVLASIMSVFSVGGRLMWKKSGDIAQGFLNSEEKGDSATE